MEKFLARPVPSGLSPRLREYLADQISRLQILVNGAALREEEETIIGDWRFEGNNTFIGSNLFSGGMNRFVANDPEEFRVGRDPDSQYIDIFGTASGNILASKSSTGNTKHLIIRVTTNEVGDLGTTEPHLKIRGRNNTDVFLIDTTSGQARFSNGDTSNPGIGFLSDVDTGFRWSSSGTFFGVSDGSDKIALAPSGLHLLNNSSLYVAEKTAAGSDVAGRGQLWVKNTTPCELWFTDDAGNDFKIAPSSGGGGGATWDTI